MYDSTIEEQACHVRQFLQHCTEKQIAFNPQKCKFGITKVTFAGFCLSSKGYQVHQFITEAISKPTNCTNLHSFFGLVNQLSSSVSTTSSQTINTTPTSPRHQNEFLWDRDHEEISKKALTTTPILSFFDAIKGMDAS